MEITEQPETEHKEAKRHKPLPRFKRTFADSSTLSFRIQPRDREILHLLFEYRFLASRQVQRLIPGSDQKILRRLQALFHCGFVDRIAIGFNEPIVYALGNRGADELVLYSGIDRGRINWTAKNRQAGDGYRAHILMIGRVRETLTLAVRQMPHTEIHSWTPEGRLTEDVAVETGGHTIKVPVIADAFFTLRMQVSNTEIQESHFFLGADRSTMTDSRYLRKLKAYWQYWKSGKHETQLKIPSFRVLTVTKSEARKENLRTVAKEADDRKTGSGIFLFACEDQLTPEEPMTLFQPIWQSPKDDSRIALLG
jgi:hypothetical protein